MLFKNRYKGKGTVISAIFIFPGFLYKVARVYIADEVSF